jgi:hypothetical protein
VVGTNETVGKLVGSSVGPVDGRADGVPVGRADGAELVFFVRSTEGRTLGFDDKIADLEGESVG